MLVEDTSCNAGIGAEHGLCLYIKTDRHVLLFDTGKTGLFLANALKMDADIASVDTCVLSHGHYDHGGGLRTFLDNNDRAKVFMNEHAFSEHLSLTNNYIGIDRTLEDNDRIIYTDDNFKIDDELSLFTGNDRQRLHEMRNDGLRVIRNGEVIPDDFIDEQYLVIKEPGHPGVMITGCSHKGIAEIVHWAADLDISYVIGGFHFMKIAADAPEGQMYMRDTADALNASGITFYTCHCTGKLQYDYMHTLMPDRLHYLAAGSCIEI